MGWMTATLSKDLVPPLLCTWVKLRKRNLTALDTNVSRTLIVKEWVLIRCSLYCFLYLAVTLDRAWPSFWHTVGTQYMLTSGIHKVVCKNIKKKKKSKQYLYSKPPTFFCQPESFFFFFLFFLGSHLQHMEIPRPGIESELQLPATATATQDPSCVWDLHDSSQQPESLTHWQRLGIKPTSSWILVGFVTAELQGKVLWILSILKT